MCIRDRPGVWERHAVAFKNRFGAELTPEIVKSAAPPGSVLGANVYYGYHDMSAFKAPMNDFEIVDHPMYRFGVRSMMSFHFDSPVPRRLLHSKTAHFPLYELDKKCQVQTLLEKKGTAYLLKRLGEFDVPEDTTDANKWVVRNTTLRNFLQFLSSQHSLSLIHI